MQLRISKPELKLNFHVPIHLTKLNWALQSFTYTYHVERIYVLIAIKVYA
jgi:hypothetical protein